MRFYLILLCLCSGLSINAQNAYTLYDNVPGNNKAYKPAYQNNYPEWAKMLYQKDVNFNNLSRLFSEWEALETNNFRPIRRYYKNWSKLVLPWVKSNGSIDLPDIESYHKNLFKLQNLKEQNQIARAISDWNFVGPKETFWLNESGSTSIPAAAPWQVNIYSLDVASTNKDILFCGTETGYVNKSIDKGESWSQSGLDYNFGGGITATNIDPKNEDVVYVSAGNQIHKTINGGATWNPLLLNGQQFQADRMEIDKSNSNKIYAAGNSGILISNDGGGQWIVGYDQPTYDIHRHPENQYIVYGLAKLSGKFALITSNDGGVTFSKDENFPNDIVDISGGLLAVTEASPNSVYAIMLSSNNSPIIYKGEPATGDWSLVASGMTAALGLNNGQGYFDLVFEVSDQNSDIIYAGTSSLYISRNGGVVFDLIGGYGGQFPIHPDIQDMKILADGEVWVATDGGLNYSSDNFTSVSNHTAKIKGMIGSDMWGFDQGWNEDLIVGGRYHNGNTSIADFYGDKALRMGGAESPTGWILKGRSRHVAFNDLGAGWILPKSVEAKPEGRFLFSKYPNMDEYGGRRGNIITHPNYFGTLILGEGTGLWKSEDSGMSYNLIYDFGSKVRYIEMAYGNPSVLYADIVDIGLHRSDDGGYTWTRKPSLTSAPNGGAWGGRLFFSISPNNENAIYACLQNGTWSSDIGRIFRSLDGGDTWEDWTGALNEYTKNIVVQPNEFGEDIVYLFTNARDKKAKVFVRNSVTQEWDEFNDGFPAGFKVNLAMPFYRDSKIRVAGNAGIWESPLYEENFKSILNPWVEKQSYSCILDTVYFDDHSIINHEGCVWRWEISPEPLYISDANTRNPKVVLGQEGIYDVTMYITKDGVEMSKHIADFVTTTLCPSIDNCENPDQLPKDIWELVSVDSEEPNAPGLAIMAFDDDPNTIWHTRWTSGNDNYPHEIVVDMGDLYLANSFSYLPRQNGTNGRVKDYELYVSSDGLDWGEPVASGVFENSFAPSIINFDQVTEGRYFRLLCLSEVNGNIWASAAELGVNGCYASSSSITKVAKASIKAFPIPSQGFVKLNLPNTQDFDYLVCKADGVLVQKGQIKNEGNDFHLFDLSNENSGVYFIKLVNSSGISYCTKIVLQK